jgi:hypothetical protein
MKRFAFPSFTLRCGLVLTFFGAYAPTVFSGQDSLHVLGWTPPTDDPLALEIPLQIKTSIHNLSWDSTWHLVPRNAPILIWTKGTMGQAQLQAEWPRYGDSLTVRLTADPEGIIWESPVDTLIALWSPATTGCFPVTTGLEAMAFVNRIKAIPFESKRELNTVQWSKNECLSTSILKLILDVFDDENRKLTLIKTANISDPKNAGTLVQSFSTARYTEAFSLWWEGVE